jgi:hypothetical protein
MDISCAVEAVGALLREETYIPHYKATAVCPAGHGPSVEFGA